MPVTRSAGLALALLLLAEAAQAQRPPLPAGAEALSLRGEPLFATALAPATLSGHQARLEEARQLVFANPGDADALIWLGRRTAYLGRFREAIAIYTEGIKKHPNDARIYRHRGHRYISVRELDRAIRDLETAAALQNGSKDQVEPDGQPNARNIPIGTLNTNIWYHLALARYLKGDYVRAADNWRRCRDAGSNADNLVSATHWLYITLMRSGRADEARKALEPVRADLDIIENGSYHSLVLLYKGERTVDAVYGAAGEGSAGSAVRYGVGAWHFVNGRRAEANKVWDGILAGPDWPSFGFIAAEAERAAK